MTEFQIFRATALLPRDAALHVEQKNTYPSGENDQALAAMFGICILLSLAMWIAFFTWLF